MLIYSGMMMKIQTRCKEKIIHEEVVLAAQEQLTDIRTASRLAQLFAALADPTRVRLISALNRREMCVCDLAAVLGMTQSAVSHQLRQLRNLSLVRFRKEGRMIFYALDDEHIQDLFERGFAHIVHESSQPK